MQFFLDSTPDGSDVMHDLLQHSSVFNLSLRFQAQILQTQNTRNILKVFNIYHKSE